MTITATTITDTTFATTGMIIPVPFISFHLDDDDIAWQQLAQSLSPHDDSSSNSSNTPSTIHPLSRSARICIGIGRYKLIPGVS